ncbi:uncharacterized protein LOC128547412 [Mercenaria mercenaria]|uniref:uncharacterized protein LOC128547412 n=1 Tax=Mercenaria mercenaria TaxID=6596 RepID=UPI00234E8422|nr:uncharacterized protein LOC128547412 [Mercenaria mercenaria]
MNCLFNCFKSYKTDEYIELIQIEKMTQDCKCNYMKQVKEFKDDSEIIINSFNTCSAHERIDCEECATPPEVSTIGREANDDSLLIVPKQYFLDIGIYRMKMEKNAEDRTEMLDCMQQYENKLLKLFSVWDSEKLNLGMKKLLVNNLLKSMEKWFTVLEEKGKYISMEKDTFQQKKICFCGTEYGDQKEDLEQQDSNTHSKVKVAEDFVFTGQDKPVTIIDTAKTEVSEDFCHELETILKEHGIRVTSSENLGGQLVPLLVICMNDTRIKSDIEAALEKVCFDNYSKAAFITVHSKSKDHFTVGDSHRELDALKTEHKKYAKVTFATDWAFKKGCKTRNSDQENKIIEFLKGETRV